MGEVKRIEFVGSGSAVEVVVLVLWLAIAEIVRGPILYSDVFIVILSV
jgi:hypothetical protein